MGFHGGIAEMVIIKDIQKDRSYVCISLDNGMQYWLKKEDLEDAGICAGTEIAEDHFNQLIRLKQYPRALSNAVAMLARRPCSKGEIRKRLREKRYTEEVSELVIYKLEKERLLNDEAFCEQWIRYRTERCCGPELIRRELKSKGISDDIIDSALRHADQETETESPVIIACKAWKRIRRDEDIRKSRQKVILSVVRKGYSWETARKACDTAEKEKNENCTD